MLKWMSELDSILDSHDWASDHNSTAKDDVEEVYGFLKKDLQRTRESMSQLLLII
jgi:hypothetical protein